MVTNKDKHRIEYFAVDPEKVIYKETSAKLVDPFIMNSKTCCQEFAILGKISKREANCIRCPLDVCHVCYDNHSKRN